MGRTVVKQKNQRDSTRSVGYSDLRLWPFYLALTSLLLISAPIIGLLKAFIFVGFPMLFAAHIVAKVERQDVVKDYEQWEAIRQLFLDIEMRDRLQEEYNAMPMVDLRGINTPPKETLENTAPIPKERAFSIAS